MNVHHVLYGDKICCPINHNKGYTKNYGSPTRGNKLRDLEQSLIIKQAKYFAICKQTCTKGVRSQAFCNCFHFNGIHSFVRCAIFCSSQRLFRGAMVRGRDRAPHITVTVFDPIDTKDSHGINARVKGCILQIPYSEN